MAKQKPDLTWPEWRAVKIAITYALKQGLCTDINRKEGVFSNKNLATAGRKLGIDVEDPPK